jgi:hypothetical protein
MRMAVPKVTADPGLRQVARIRSGHNEPQPDGAPAMVNQS